jgi:hypothetical protein
MKFACGIVLLVVIYTTTARLVSFKNVQVQDLTGITYFTFPALACAKPNTIRKNARYTCLRREGEGGVKETRGGGKALVPSYMFCRLMGLLLK